MIKPGIAAVTAMLCLSGGVALAAPRPEPKTDAAVIAAAYDWLGAERCGDVRALDVRLAPEYRDIRPDGTVHTKQQLLNYTAVRKDKATGTTQEVAAAYRLAHPIVEKAVIRGDTAIVSYHSVDPATQAVVRSFDVFTYDHGVWRGMISGHPKV